MELKSQWSQWEHSCPITPKLTTRSPWPSKTRSIISTQLTITALMDLQVFVMVLLFSLQSLKLSKIQELIEIPCLFLRKSLVAEGMIWETKPAMMTLSKSLSSTLWSLVWITLMFFQFTILTKQATAPSKKLNGEPCNPSPNLEKPGLLVSQTTAKSQLTAFLR